MKKGDGGWGASPAREWFGKWNKLRMRRILRVLRRMQKRVRGRAVIFRPWDEYSTKKKRRKKGNKCNASAIVGARPAVIKICIPGFFAKRRSRCSRKKYKYVYRLARIIVHELAHSAGVGGKPGKSEKVDAQARSMPVKKRTNNADNYADNYAWYCFAQYYSRVRKRKWVEHFLDYCD